MATTSPIPTDASTYASWSMNGTVGSTAKKADDTGVTAHALSEVGALGAGVGQTTPTSNGTYNTFGGTKYLTVTNANLTSWPTGSQTWHTWINLSSVSPAQGLMFIFSKQGSTSGSYLGVNTGGTLGGRVTDGTTTCNFTSTGSLSTGAWYYIAIVFIPSTSLTVYINGSVDSTNTTSIPTSAIATTQDFYISSQSNITGTAGFQILGDIDSLVLDGTNRSATYISNYYNNVGTTNANFLAFM